MFFFLVAGLFWSASVLFTDPHTKILGFWYAVAFNNAGYITLAVHGVTFG